MESGESPRSNILRRFPGLANRYTPRRSYARRPAQEEVFGEPAVSPRGPMATTATTATATRLDSVGSRRREDERRKNGPMAEARQNLLLNRDSTWSALSPRTMHASTGSPRSRPAFAPCNPSQAKASIARPRDVLVGAACPYGSVHDAITDAKRVHEHRMVGGSFVPSSGLSRSLIANAVTLLSKDAPTVLSHASGNSPSNVRGPTCQNSTDHNIVVSTVHTPTYYGAHRAIGVAISVPGTYVACCIVGTVRVNVNGQLAWFWRRSI